MGRMLGFIESFPFFQIRRRPWVFVGPVALTCVCVFQSDFSTPTRVSLIVVPDKKVVPSCTMILFSSHTGILNGMGNGLHGDWWRDH